MAKGRTQLSLFRMSSSGQAATERAIDCLYHRLDASASNVMFSKTTKSFFRLCHIHSSSCDCQSPFNIFSCCGAQTPCRSLFRSVYRSNRRSVILPTFHSEGASSRTAMQNVNSSHSIVR